MRHKSKLVLIAIIATLVASAMASASASASSGFKINGSPFTGTETITARLTSTKLEFEMNFGGPTLDLSASCTGVSATGGKITETVKLKGEKFVLTGCKVVTVPACKFATESVVPTETLETAALKGEVVEEASKHYINFSPITGEKVLSFRFAEIGCGQLNESKHSLVGSIRCLVPTSVEEVTKGCEFTATSGTALHLEGGSFSQAFIGTFGFALSGTNVGKIWGVS